MNLSSRFDSNKLKVTLENIFVPQRKRIGRYTTASLDGLRGIGALAVLIQHLAGNQLLPMFDSQNIGKSLLGRSGVVLFFVLSSFLLTSKLANLKSFTSKNVWINYLFRRFIRIFPLYTSVLIVYLIFPGFNFGLQDFWQHLFLLKGFNHFWTIPVEFYAYIVLPFLIFASVSSLKHRTRNMLGILLSITLIIYLSGYTGDLTKGYSTPFTLFAFLPVFMMGSFASLINQRILLFSRQTQQRLSYYGEIGALAAMVILIWLSCYSTISLYEGTLLCGFLWSIFLIFHLHGRGLIMSLFSHPILRFFGTISFSIYLWHLGIMGYLNTHLPGAVGLKFITIVLTTIAVSIASYLLIEYPFMKLKLDKLWK